MAPIQFSLTVTRRKRHPFQGFEKWRRRHVRALHDRPAPLLSAIHVQIKVHVLIRVTFSNIRICENNTYRPTKFVHVKLPGHFR